MSSPVRLSVEIGSNDAPVEVHPVLEHQNGHRIHGMVTLTEPLRRERAEQLLFLNPTYGRAMNQDGLFSGTAVLIHDGTDNSAWTASNIIGSKMTANSSDRANTGSFSVKVNRASVSDVWQFAIPAGSQDLTNYVALTMFINVDRDWAVGDSIELYGWDGAQVGNSIKLEDYFLESDFDTWQPLIIPLSDMGLTGETVTAFRMTTVSKSGNAPIFYIDDFQIEELGQSIRFKAENPSQNRYRAHRMVIIIAAADSGVVASGTMPGLAHDKLLSLTRLTNGIRLIHLKKGKVIFDVPIRDLGDFLAIGYYITNSISDGTNTCITLEIEFPYPLFIQGNTDQNYISIDIQDNLSNLLRFNASIRGTLELGDDE